jgi:hypothetical protein
MDLTAYREGKSEQARIADLLAVLPKGHSTVLEIGARDGYISRILTNYFEEVTALDLEKPPFTIDRVHPVKGDVTHLEYPDNGFDVVFCTEVLEHIPPSLLATACAEIARVARHSAVIGVPYRQDIRLGRTTCRSCGCKNPPWGHLNSFDENRLKHLFKGMQATSITFVGERKHRTSAVAAFLMDLGGNPWGVYSQEEPCIRCGSKLVPPQMRNVMQKICSRLALQLNRLQDQFVSPTGNWIHIVFQKTGKASERKNGQP